MDASQPPAPAAPAAVPRTALGDLSEQGLAELDDEAIELVAERAALWWRRQNRFATLGIVGPMSACVLGGVVSPDLFGPLTGFATLAVMGTITLSAIGGSFVRRLLADELRSFGYDKPTAKAALKAWVRAQRRFLPSITLASKERAIREELSRARDGARLSAGRR
jgi:hypothetical protein